MPLLRDEVREAALYEWQPETAGKLYPGAWVLVSGSPDASVKGYRLPAEIGPREFGDDPPVALIAYARGSALQRYMSEHIARSIDDYQSFHEDDVPDFDRECDDGVCGGCPRCTP